MRDRPVVIVGVPESGKTKFLERLLAYSPEEKAEYKFDDQYVQSGGPFVDHTKEIKGDGDSEDYRLRFRDIAGNERQLELASIWLKHLGQNGTGTLILAVDPTQPFAEQQEYLESIMAMVASVSRPGSIMLIATKEDVPADKKILTDADIERLGEILEVDEISVCSAKTGRGIASLLHRLHPDAPKVEESESKRSSARDLQKEIKSHQHESLLANLVEYINGKIIDPLVRERHRIHNEHFDEATATYKPDEAGRVNALTRAVATINEMAEKIESRDPSYDISNTAKIKSTLENAVRSNLIDKKFYEHPTAKNEAKQKEPKEKKATKVRETANKVLDAIKELDTVIPTPSKRR